MRRRPAARRVWVHNILGSRQEFGDLRVVQELLLQ